MGAIYGLFPLVVMEKSGITAHVAASMAVIIFGGMALQYPVGRLSDYIERRTVLLFLAIITIGIAFCLMSSFTAHISISLLFIFGGITLPFILSVFLILVMLCIMMILWQALKE